jgi:hypothetical protein
VRRLGRRARRLQGAPDERGLQRCVSFPQVGDACSPGTTPICIGGYCATSTCVAFKGLGASCTFDFECASFNCNAVTNVCTLGYCVMP